jgi:hypothetical protein
MMQEEVSLPEESAAFYRNAMRLLREAEIPFLVGGAYAFACYTNITRHTKDFDLFLEPHRVLQALSVLAEAGYQTEKTFPHWLAKAYSGDEFVDLIFRSGNGLSEVSERWFSRSTPGQVLGVDVALCPAEEIIWTKAFVQERERYDGADVAHLLLWCSQRIDWEYLLDLFGDYWRILFAHLVLFGFVYPSERKNIPDEVIRSLSERLAAETASPPAVERVCRGTLLSRAQYLVDVERWGFDDARMFPHGHMTSRDVADWTDAIDAPD